MAKERARKRAEREAAAAVQKEHRRKQVARREKSARRKDAVRGLVPDVNRRPGILAARQRRRLWAFVAGIVAIQLVIWPFLPSWGARLVVLALTLIAAPVVWVLTFGRV